MARRLGAEKQGETDLFGHAADIWVTSRDKWHSAPAPQIEADDRLH
jgi:hypothetical protein